MNPSFHSLIVVGGGAAGFFGALSYASHAPGARILVLEKGRELLSKVRISGGGRCNVTHACFDARELAAHYPRGQRELVGPLSRFGPADTIDWFESRGVALKTEADGRMFPISDSSQTIIDCLLREAQKAQITIQCSAAVRNLIAPRKAGDTWQVVLQNGEICRSNAVLVASGSNRGIWEILSSLGHRIIPPVPSLFTFQVKDKRIDQLQGLSVPSATVTIPGANLTESGPLLITHWGLSGPAILKLSARGARQLHEAGYHFLLTINWLQGDSEGSTIQSLNAYRVRQKGKAVGRQTLWTDLPQRLWLRLLEAAGIKEHERWADLSGRQIASLAKELTCGEYLVTGKSTFKEEFVTAGGVDLTEVDFRRFESKLHPGLFLAGETLNIDALTGGFNFQAAWTGGFLAGMAAAEQVLVGRL